MKIGKERILSMYEQLFLLRNYEDRIYYMFLEGIMPGTIHQSQGQEACAVGVLFDVRKEDYMTSTHRPAGHCLAKGVSLESMMCEMFAKANGCCKGKGGAMHTGDISVGAIPAVAITAGGMPVAIGAGLSCKMRKTDNVVICFFGDGASNEGAFHESMNAAAIWNLPVVFVCENNLYGASTHINQVIKIKDLAERAAAYGMPGYVADGNDVLAVNKAANEAIDRARKGKGPTLLELKTYRRCGHSRNDACGYRDKQEEKEWFEKDPVARCKNYILQQQLAAPVELEAIEKKVLQQIDDAVAFAKASPSPEPQDALLHVYA
ncbi:MAG: thiamine pyrophosphate-dependent dehydrogenase E1 component subunit alpha [Chitinophagaceae bacterium]|nr:thiamine pyrophosphate-dependent dehydrogenase E1 component subunit alpha [Chitinophagaceae bacterium]